MADDPVMVMLERGRKHPNHCAFCGRPKELHIDLTTVDDTATRVEHAAEGVPACRACLVRYLTFAGDAAAVMPGRSR